MQRFKALRSTVGGYVAGAEAAAARAEDVESAAAALVDCEQGAQSVDLAVNRRSAAWHGGAAVDHEVTHSNRGAPDHSVYVSTPSALGPGPFGPTVEPLSPLKL